MKNAVYSFFCLNYSLVHVIQPQVKELKQLQAQTAQLKQYLQEIDQYVSQLENTVKEL